MAENTVRKIAPFIETDIFAAESWLSDMAAKGLFFKEGAFWWKLIFEKGDPAKRRYRLVPAEHMELYTITTGEMSVYESAGWHYAGVYQGCSSRVFYTEDENAEEIYTDSEGLEFFYKRQRSKVLLPSVLMIALLISLKLQKIHILLKVEKLRELRELQTNVILSRLFVFKIL